MVLPEHLRAWFGGASSLADGRVSFFSKMEDWTRLRLLEQVGYPMCVWKRGEAPASNSALGSNVLKRLGRISGNCRAAQPFPPLPHAVCSDPSYLTSLGFHLLGCIKVKMTCMCCFNELRFCQNTSFFLQTGARESKTE